MTQETWSGFIDTAQMYSYNRHIDLFPHLKLHKCDVGCQFVSSPTGRAADVFVCRATGNVHLCGDSRCAFKTLERNCNRKIQSFVCPLTGHKLAIPLRNESGVNRITPEADVWECDLKPVVRPAKKPRDVKIITRDLKPPRKKQKLEPEKDDIDPSSTFTPTPTKPLYIEPVEKKTDNRAHYTRLLGLFRRMKPDKKKRKRQQVVQKYRPTPITMALSQRAVTASSITDNQFEATLTKSVTEEYSTFLDKFNGIIKSVLVPFLMSKSAKFTMTDTEITEWGIACTRIWIRFKESKSPTWKSYGEQSNEIYHAITILLLMKDRVCDKQIPYLPTLAARLPSGNKIKGRAIKRKTLTKCMKRCKVLLFSKNKSRV
jgi:hypothetical protein